MQVRKKRTLAALAQLDRVFGYEPKGQGFESLTPRHKRGIIASNDASFVVWCNGFEKHCRIAQTDLPHFCKMIYAITTRRLRRVWVLIPYAAPKYGYGITRIAKIPPAYFKCNFFDHLTFCSACDTMRVRKKHSARESKGVKIYDACNSFAICGFEKRKRLG